MAAKVTAGSANQAMHTAGIYADMSVDGPEIGTLIVVLDRAKNLPNRRTVGKQNPYCAARLGKEAKKTKTDIRGGQTPKWDQELRFTVHDSPDYNSLKLSVFNDDKKTDLIGETWIDLLSVLRPGGGQSDQWHGLNCKGRYAGEIRIELTYYDSRPKVEKSRDKRQSTADGTERTSSPSIGGVRPQQTSIRRRPLPNEPGTMHPSTPEVDTHSTPIPISGPRSYHTPPHTESNSESYLDEFTNGIFMSQSLRSRSGGTRRSLPDPPIFQPSPRRYDNAASPDNLLGQQPLYVHDMDTSQHGFAAIESGAEDYSDNYIPATDDPYALQAVDAYHEVGVRRDSSAPLPQPRHIRVQALSGGHARPPAELALHHTHSAPPFTNVHQAEHMQDSGHSTPPTENSAAMTFYQNSEYHNQANFDPNSSFDSEIYASQHQPLNNHGESSHSGPPPPPAHRNSAPAVPRQPRPSPTPEYAAQSPQALPFSNSADYGGHEVQSLLKKYAAPPDSHLAVAQPQRFCQDLDLGHRRQMSADGLHHDYQNGYEREYSTQPPSTSFKQRVRERASLPALDPRINYNQLKPLDRGTNRPPGFNNRSQQISQPDHQYQQVQVRGPAGHRLSAPSPVVKPRPISPTRQPFVDQHMRTPQPPTSPQSPSSPYVNSQGTMSSVPYSPDSFAIFNPRHSNPATPITSSAPGTPQQVSPRGNIQPNAKAQIPHASPVVVAAQDPPIIGSDGRVRDPSDHLPPSSYAPEPERKGNRPSTVVNIKNRFGPREAPPLPVVTRPPRSAHASPTVANGTGRGGITLQRPQQTALNAQHVGYGSASPPQQGYGGVHGYGYDRVEMFAPPVPRKIPLDLPDVTRDGAANATQLSLNMASMSLGATKSPPPSNDLPSRIRRSRWGA